MERHTIRDPATGRFTPKGAVPKRGGSRGSVTKEKAEKGYLPINSPLVMDYYRSINYEHEIVELEECRDKLQEQLDKGVSYEELHDHVQEIIDLQEKDYPVEIDMMATVMDSDEVLSALLKVKMMKAEAVITGNEELWNHSDEEEARLALVLKRLEFVEEYTAEGAESFSADIEWSFCMYCHEDYDESEEHHCPESKGWNCITCGGNLFEIPDYLWTFCMNCHGRFHNEHDEAILIDTESLCPSCAESLGAESFSADTIITEIEWADFERVRQSGVMNMMGHWNALKFIVGDNYTNARKWFQEDGNTEDLVIKGAESLSAEEMALIVGTIDGDPALHFYRQGHRDAFGYYTGKIITDEPEIEHTLDVVSNLPNFDERQKKAFKKYKRNVWGTKLEAESFGASPRCVACNGEGCRHCGYIGAESFEAESERDSLWCCDGEMEFLGATADGDAVWVCPDCNSQQIFDMTEEGKLCPRCTEPMDECVCAEYECECCGKTSAPALFDGGLCEECVACYICGDGEGLCDSEGCRGKHEEYTMDNWDAEVNANPMGGSTGDQVVQWEDDGLSSPSAPPSNIHWAEGEVCSMCENTNMCFVSDCDLCETCCDQDVTEDLDHPYEFYEKDYGDAEDEDEFNGMDVFEPSKNDIKNSERVLKQKYGSSAKMLKDTVNYVTYRQGSSNKFHCFFVAEIGGVFYAFNTFGRIGYTNIRLHKIAGPMDSKSGAVRYMNDKMWDKISKKGYEQYPGGNPFNAEFEAIPGLATQTGVGSLMDIGKDTDLSAFSPEELTKSTAIHGDFDTASLDYSGHQNIEVKGLHLGRAENFEATDAHSYKSNCVDCGKFTRDSCDECGDYCCNWLGSGDGCVEGVFNHDGSYHGEYTGGIVSMCKHCRDEWYAHSAESFGAEGELDEKTIEMFIARGYILSPDGDPTNPEHWRMPTVVRQPVESISTTSWKPEVGQTFEAEGELDEKTIEMFIARGYILSPDGDSTNPEHWHMPVVERQPVGWQTRELGSFWKLDEWKRNVTLEVIFKPEEVAAGKCKRHGDWVGGPRLGCGICVRHDKKGRWRKDRFPWSAKRKSAKEAEVILEKPVSTGFKVGLGVIGAYAIAGVALATTVMILGRNE